jgi:hypothetical protein
MLLVIVNLLMMAVGGVMLITGIVFKLGKEDLVPQLSDYSTSMEGISLFVIIVGAVVAIVGLLGCMGACLKKNGILNFYFLIVLVTLVLQVALIIFTILKKDAVIAQVTEAVTDTFNAVNDGTATDKEKQATSYLESAAECCGLTGPAFWTDNTQPTDMVPAGCCEGYEADATVVPAWTCARTDAYEAGCLKAAPDMIKDNAWTLLIIVIIIMVVEIVCMLAACYSKKNDLVA